MADVIKLVQADTLPQLKLVITDDITGLPVSLVGSTVNLHVRAQGTSVLAFTRPATLNIGGDASLQAVNGVAIVQWLVGDLDRAPGLYEAEVEVVFSTGRETIYDLITLQIREDIA